MKSKLTFPLVGCALGILIPELALAGVDSDSGETLGIVREWLTGKIGAGIAVATVAFLVIGGVCGKVSTGMALGAGFAIAMIFGLDAVMDAICVDS